MEEIIKFIPEEKRGYLMKVKNYYDEMKAGQSRPVSELNGKKLIPGFLPETAKFAKEEWNGIRKNDVFVASFPKTGTNWTMEVVRNIICHDDPKSLAIMRKLPTPFSVVEMGPAIKYNVIDSLPINKGVMGTHLDGEEFPIEKVCEKGAKVVYVMRNPKDQTVSWFHFANKMPLLKKTGIISEDWNKFTQDYFAGKHPGFVKDGEWYPDHILTWYKHKDIKNVKFIYFEDMKKDLPLEVRKLAEFLEVELTEDEVAKIVKACGFDEMKKTLKNSGNGERSDNFLRKGGVGGWKSNFTVAQSEAVDAIFDEKLANTDITFTYQL